MVEELDEKKIRQYLLGELTEAEMSPFEERLMTDDGLFGMLLFVEDELIDERAANELSAEEQARFDTYFLATPQRRERLQLARALHDYAARPAPKPVDNPNSGATNEPANATPSENPSERVVVDFPSQAKETRSSRWSSPRRYLTLAAAAVILLAVAIAALRIIIPRSDVSKGLTALNQAYREQRPTEARITGLNYAPAPPITRGSEQENFDYLARDRAEAWIHAALAEHADAQSYHNLGRLYLAKHEYDKAIEQFDKALRLAEKNAQLESDYGAALMERGKAERLKGESSKSLEDFAKSLEHLNKAIDLDGSLLESLFNRALCHQDMGLFQQAEEDWQTYLEKEPNSEWSNEARRRLQLLQEQKRKALQNQEQLYNDFLRAYQMRDDKKAWMSFRQSRTRRGNFIIEKLIDVYLNLEAQDKIDEARSNLQLLSYAGDLEAKHVSDYSAAHIAQFYASTTSSQRVVLAQARSLIKMADAQSDKSKYKEAVNSYNNARLIFYKLNDNCEARYVEYRIAHCFLRQTGARASSESFARLAEICEENKHKWLLALVYSSLADAYNSISEYSKGLYYSTQALRISEEIEDADGMASCYLQIGIGYRKVGDYRQSLTFLQQGLLLAGDRRLDLSLLWVYYDVAAENFKSLDLYAAAVDYQKEALHLAVEIDSPLNLSRSYVHLGFIYGKLKNYDEAIETADRAFDIGKNLSDEPIGREMMAYTSLYLGDLHRLKGDYGAALTYYDQNINIYANIGFPLHLYATHKGKLLCYIAQGDNPAAENELKTTLSLFEQYRSKILEENNRNQFFDIEQNIYDTAIAFEYSRASNDEAAFERSEESRARSLLDLADKDIRVIHERFGPDLTLAPDSQPLRLAEIKSRLPAQSQIMQYAVLEDKLLIWIVSQSVFSSKEEKIGLAELGEKVNGYLQKISRPSVDTEEAKDDARELYDLLIKPVERFLDKGKYLCIIPDKMLNRLPFCALVSESGNYLVNDYLLGICPSSSIFIKRSDSARGKKGLKAERLLAVGNPSFDRAEFSWLQDLPAAAREAEEIAALYKMSPLLGSRARENLIKREIANSDVIHLAAHYVANQRSHLLSAFLLAREPTTVSQDFGNDGQLQVQEIYAMKLSRPRLVVLAACQTGIEKTYQGEGAISVARPFIAAGVPVIVASLWPVELDSTSTLMINFHTYRKRDGRSTSEALRLAQLAMINDPDGRLHHPYYWAPFAVIGGYATF